MTPRNDIAQVAAQIGSVLLPDTKTWVNRFEVPSRTSDSKYVIAQRRTDGTWGCSCWGWRRHRKCPHVPDVLRRLAALAVADNATHYAPQVANILASARTAYLDLDVAPIDASLPRLHGREVDL